MYLLFVFVLLAKVTLVVSCNAYGASYASPGISKGIVDVVNERYRVHDCKTNDFNTTSCTHFLKDRIIRIESNYNSGYWISNEAHLKFLNRDKIYAHKESVSWKVHQCTNDFVALEGLNPRNYYAYYSTDSLGGETLSIAMEYKSRNPCEDERKQFGIACEDCSTGSKCRFFPARLGDNYRPYNLAIIATYHPTERTRIDNCRLTAWSVWVYIATDAYETDKVTLCNRLKTDEKLSYEITESLTTSTSTTTTTSITDDIEFKYEFLKALTGSAKVTHKTEWAHMSSQQTSISKTIKVGGSYGVTVKPGKRVIIERLTGYYGDFVYTSNNYILEQEDCV